MINIHDKLKTVDMETSWEAANTLWQKVMN